MGLFKKKKGGTFFGNLLASVANKATGGVLGSKRVAALQSGNIASINPNAEAGKTFKTVFGGEPATVSKDGTINIEKPLQEVSVSAPSTAISTLNQPGFLDRLIGDKLSYLGARTTENMQVGADNKTLMIVGGGIAALIITMLAMKK
jgi:predicted glycoside hydrolase/deacetylase ChbG (UPF0249 family)